MAEQAATQETAQPIQEDRDYLGVMKALVGKKVTVVNPESYEIAPMGFTIKAGSYPAKVAGWGQDYVILQTTIAAGKKEGGVQAVQQFIPMHRIKRISAMKAGILVHI